MCGLVGVAGVIDLKVEKAFKRMLELDTIRGPHSTGIVSVRHKGTREMIKKLGTPWDLYQYKGYTNMMAKRHRMLLGHNRWATKGAITAVNAHPFEHGSIIGMHNGTLNSWHNLKDHTKFNVDSEALYYDMSVNGFTETVEKLNGAFALCWHDEKDDSLNFIRNKDRPLYFGATKGRKTLFWASESFMIRQAAAAAGLDMEPIGLTEPMQHYGFTIPTDGSEIATPKGAILEEYSPPKYVPPQGGNFKGGQLPLGTSPNPSGSESKVVPIGDGKLLPMAKYLNKEIPIEVVDTITNNGQKHLLCVHADHDTVEVRLYLSKEDERWKTMMESINFFTVKPKSYRSGGSGYKPYLVGDLRSITELEGPDWDNLDDESDGNTKSITGYRGRVLSTQEFKECTSAGCAYCGDPIPIEDAHNGGLEWYGEKDVLGLCCLDSPFARKTVQEYYVNG